MVEFEWDDAKALSNLAKHGIDFEDATNVFLDPRLREIVDGRWNYGEIRRIAYGRVEGTLFAVVYTLRGKARRIISARRATRAERKMYGQDPSIQT